MANTGKGNLTELIRWASTRWSGDPTNELKVSIAKRGYGSTVLIDASTAIANNGYIATVAEDISEYSSVSIMVVTDGSLTVQYQLNDDGTDTDWFDPKNVSDTTLTWNCNNEKVAIPVDVAGNYIRIFISNSSGASVNVLKLVLVGQS